MTENICPYLGSLGDPMSCTTCATEDNLCYASGEGETIPKSHQKKFCLGGKLTVCQRFPSESMLTIPSVAAADTYLPRDGGLEDALRPDDRPVGGFSATDGFDETVEEDTIIGADETLVSAEIASREPSPISEKKALSEDAYFDSLQDEQQTVEPLTPATDDFYFDEIDKATLNTVQATSPGTQDYREDKTLVMDLSPLRDKEVRPAVSQPAPDVRADVTLVDHKFHPSIASMAPPTPAVKPQEPSANGPTPSAPERVESARPAPPSSESAASLFDTTVIIPRISVARATQPTPQTPPAQPPEVGLPEPAIAKRKDRLPEDNHPGRERAGVDPAWLVRRAAAQAEQAQAKEAPEEAKPKRSARSVPEPLPRTLKARAVAQSIPVTKPVTRPAPEQLAPSPRRGRSKVFAYLAFAIGLLALLLVCSGTVLVRRSLLAGGPSTGIPLSLTGIPLNLPASLAALRLGSATEAAPTDMASPTAPEATAITELLVTEILPTGAAPVTVTQPAAATEEAVTGIIPTNIAQPTLTQPAQATVSAPMGPPSATPTMLPTREPTATPTLAAVATQPVQTNTPVSKVTQTSTPTVMPSPSPSPSPSSTATATVKPTSTSTSTATATATPKPTASPTPSPTASPTPTLAKDQGYAIQQGDTLYGIALQYGITVDELLQANPKLNPQLLRVGQEVKIPTKKSGEVTPAATQPPTPTVTPTPQGPVTYVIQGGDTFLSLAIKYKLAVEDLLEANPGIDPRRMQMGQEVKIPQPSGTTGTTVAEVVTTPAANAAKGTAPTRITASSIGLDAKVVEIGSHKETQQGTEVTVWEEADFAAGLHRGSAYPGQVGNIVISARHNSQGEVFRHIAELQEGAEIQLYAGDKVYRYVVEQILIIPDKYISAEKRRENEAWIGSTSDERLTLISFWPYETNTHRVIVIAKPAAAITPQPTPAVTG